MILAIIPARGGSKRIKNKNIINFFQKPIIGWTIEELKKIKKKKIIDKIVVSSDSNKILNISKKFGADILVKRVKKLSDDKTPFQKVIKDVIKKSTQLKFNVSEIIVVFPSAVLIEANDIISALKTFRKNKNSFVISISKYPHPPQRAYIKSNSNKLSFIDKNNELKNTQNFNELFHDAGQFYIGNKKLWLSKNIHSNSRGFLLPRTKSVDLDTKEDLNLLKFLFSKKKK
jgi:pseudaminic acid cytidylyltransferase